MVRAAAKNHANVAIVDVTGALSGGPGGARTARPVLDDGFGARWRSRHSPTPRHTTPGSQPSSRVASSEAGLLDAPDDPYPPTLTIALEKVETLRYGENPHQPAARYRRPGSPSADGPFATGEPPLQGKALSYNNVLDASAAAALGRALRGPACVIVKHTNPCGAAERPTSLEAWEAALAGDPVSAFGGVVALTRPVDAGTRRGAGLDLPRGRRRARVRRRGARRSSPPSRTSVSSSIADLAGDGPDRPPDPIGSIRSAGGAVLVTAPDTVADDPTTWTVATRRAPTDPELLDLDLAWRLVRGVTSNAIVLVRDRRLIGMGSGQTSRVDAARGAVEKARAHAGRAALRGRRLRFGRLLPVRRRRRGLPGGRGDRLRPAGRVGPRRRGGRGRRRRRGAMVMTGTRHFRH